MSETPSLERASFAGRRALVLGLGKFSGGLETVRFLRQEGADVLVSDSAPRTAIAAAADEAASLGAQLQLGRPQGPDLLADCDVVLVNPAVPFDHPVILAAAERGVPVTTETNIVLARAHAPVLAVTGTKGKSTTASLLAHMLEAAGRTAHLGGNIGRALVAQLPRIQPTHRIVLELSSFQLWWARAAARSPHVALVTNLLSDHLDRHGTQEAYAEAKRAILDFQGPADLAVLPADDDAVREAGWLETGQARRVTYGPGGVYQLDGTRVVCVETGITADLAGMSLLGAHNRRNALAAATAVMELEPDTHDAVRTGALATQPLPHRLDPVGEVHGVLYIDDSNATHPTSTVCALEAVERPVVLVAGGKDKGADAAPLLTAIRARTRGLVAIGSSGPALLEGLGGDVRALSGEPDMETAVRAAASLARPGDVVLLSPAFSSLDQYASFAERGDRFRAAVRSLEASDAASSEPRPPHGGS